MTERRLAIVGSRDFPNWKVIEDFINGLKSTTTVVSGGARGVDRVAVMLAQKRGLETQEFHADWEAYGQRAGFLRNEKMIATVHGLVAFWDGQSRGTQHAIGCAKKRGIWLQVRNADGAVTEQGGKT